MSWITISDEDAMASTAQERMQIAAVKGKDDLAEIVSECVDIFRDAIRSSGQPLGPEGTLPRSLRGYALSRAVWLFVTRGVPENKGIQSASRKQGAERAEAILQQIIDQKLKVIAQDYTQTISHGVASVRRGRKVRTDSFDKLGET